MGEAGMKMDTSAVMAVGKEVEQLADAVGADKVGAVAYAGGSAVTAECFGRMPESANVGNAVMDAVRQLAESLGHAGAFMTGTVGAIKQAVGVTQANEEATTEAVNKAGEGV
ncbi:hypothetical protein [Amycolatopsis suaedae]|uniref:Uncharacterized protein n=1 Tax=Amycolatopsis suaedae TaxID=2510978 RepID=A0A4Q7J8P6_9PSEU|nr:hypothetical protein [Amycolatopsis suaedae]RZQ64081.1 hypothetical protein EWH70_08775 [Amycolatopsis suaedae]